MLMLVDIYRSSVSKIMLWLNWNFWRVLCGIIGKNKSKGIWRIMGRKCMSLVGNGIKNFELNILIIIKVFFYGSGLTLFKVSTITSMI